MSRLSKYNKKPIIKLKKGLVIKTDEIFYKFGDVRNEFNPKTIEVEVLCENDSSELKTIFNTIMAVSSINELIKNNNFTIVKDGPIDPKKFLTKFKFS